MLRRSSGRIVLEIPRDCEDLSSGDQSHADKRRGNGRETIPEGFETPKEPGLFPGDSPELFSGSIIAGVQSAKEINMSSCGSERQLLRRATSDIGGTLSHDRETIESALTRTCALRHLFRGSRAATGDTGRDGVAMAVGIDDLESQLSSRIDEHAVDEHYPTAGRN